MAAAKRKQDDKNLAILRELITHNGNKNCFDCSQRGPTYVNMTIGSFVCSKCSGMLRGLTPPHRVKSISMATFTPEEIGQIKSQGNDYCKTIWLALDEGSHPLLKDEQSIKDYMSDKYEKKRYYLEPNSVNKQLSSVQKPPSVQNISPKDNGIWNSSSTRQPAVEPSIPITQVPPAFNIPKPPLPSSNIEPLNVQTSSCPRFPVDFASADIFNSSQLNNNLIIPATHNQISFANFDIKNANAETHDRYAALADLDFALRQQHQTQSQDENKSSNNVNPFEMNSVSQVSKNPFYPNALAVNGNNVNYSNPFAMGSAAAPAGQSKNPFL